jgi:hypothetical protein
VSVTTAAPKPPTVEPKSAKAKAKVKDAALDAGAAIPVVQKAHQKLIRDSFTIPKHPSLGALRVFSAAPGGVARW